MLAPAEVAGRNFDSSKAGASRTDRGDEVKDSCDGDVRCASAGSGARRVVAPACLGKAFALDAEYVEVEEGRDILAPVDVEVLAE